MPEPVVRSSRAGNGFCSAFDETLTENDARRYTPSTGKHGYLCRFRHAFPKAHMSFKIGALEPIRQALQAERREHRCLD